METTVAAKASSPDDGYADYVPTATDPDWWFTVYIVAGCLLINLSLPLWIYLGKCCGFNERSRDRRRKSKATGWENQNVNFDNDNDNNCNNNNNNYDSNIGEDILMKQLDEARSIISGCYSYAPGGDGVYPHPTGSAVSGSIARSRAGTHLGFNHHPHTMHGPSSPGSVFSSASGFTNAVLSAKPKRSKHAGRRAGKTKRIMVAKSAVIGDNEGNHGIQTMGKLDVRMAAEYTKAEIDLLQQRKQVVVAAAVQQQNESNCIVNTNTITITPTTSSEVDLGSSVDDSRSDVAPSILSKLDADAISVQDAVDARDGGLSPLGSCKTANYGSDDNMMKSSYGFRNPMYERLFEIVDWDKEMKKYLALASHYSIQGILVEILGLVEISLIGHLMGIDQASAYIVVGVVTGLTEGIPTGFYECTGVLVPQADGARNYLMIGRYMQLGILFYCVTALPAAIMWSFYMEKTLLWWGLDEVPAAMGQKYLLVVLPTFFTGGIDAVLYEVLNTVGYQRYATGFTVVSSVIHTSVVAGMLYWGVKDLYILGLFEMSSSVLCLILNFGIMVYMGWLDDYWEGLFKTNGLKDFRAVRNVFITALPLSFGWVLTYGEWEIMSFFAKVMGSDGAEVVAWGLMGYIWSAFETLTDGFGDAAEVRVGFRMGAGHVRLAKLGADKAMYVSFTVAVYSTGILFVLAMYLPGWLTPDPTLQRMIFDIIPLIGFGQIWMVWGMVAWAILGAQGRIHIATALEFFISWGIGAPIAAIMTFVFNYNLEGLVGAMTISYTIGTNVYLYMLHTSDWEALSAVVVARNSAEGLIYDEFDWSELPDNIRDAAITLGYNESIWEMDEEEPESDEKIWEELNPAEQKAAGLLGYTKKTWNQENDTVSSVEEKLPYDGYSFNSLPLEAKKAALCLGYNKETWGVDGEPPANDKKWDELTSDEQTAAEFLGYDSRKWAVVHSRDFSVLKDDWASLSKEAKSAAKVLGYTATIWKQNGSVPAEDKDWNELKKKERAAARILGYTEENWSEADDESDSTPKLIDTTSSRNLSKGVN
mmetsp:Transcript_36906/g.41219  ORF Transcript_36906/g.41219 Transcript_36906/m.41219 type:complete len:1044 (+) Transcript_36906:450-3581(+)